VPGAPADLSGRKSRESGAQPREVFGHLLLVQALHRVGRLDRVDLVDPDAPPLPWPVPRWLRRSPPVYSWRALTGQ
jgi:hypothetical protein